MFRKHLLISGVLALLASCSSMTTYVDYDRDADLDSYHTFAWAENTEPSMEKSAPLMHARTVDYITRKLVESGLELVESDPDLEVTYHTSEKEEVRLHTTHLGYGYGPAWQRDPYWGRGIGMSTSTTEVETYTKGTLIVDIWDAGTNQLVWRGSVESAVPSAPRKAERRIYEAIDSMIEKWREMRQEERAPTE